MQNVAAWTDAMPLDLDAELVEAAKRDRSRFGELYERHADGIYSYLLARTADEQDA